LPAFAFGNAERRFVIGERYEIAKGVMATLTTATVVEPEKKVHLAFYTDDGKAPILTAELSDAELAAYREHPHTFFGKIVRPPGRSNTPMELFDFFVYGCRNTPRERLLEFLAGAPDIEDLKKLSTEDLRLVYAERTAYGAMRLRKVRPSAGQDQPDVTGRSGLETAKKDADDAGPKSES
jgi:hypothetical protein